ncbi:MAG: hypothetical protein KC543_03005 [Myxococcales bacterium]|nr:hypothetical protein [Myxococcales bacterium]
MANRMTWNQICNTPDFQGRWVALQGPVYDAGGRASEGAVVDCDANLASLCQRVRDASWTDCAIVRVSN